MRLNAIVAALTILLFSPAVLALSLGEAKTQSHLNQPLKASITVRAVKYDERDTIRAIIPGEDKFKRSGVRRDAIVDNIKVDVADGTAEDELIIHLSTDKRIQEPFLSFLVEVRWLGGSVIREYTLLLDPAPIAEARSSQSGSQDVVTTPQAQPLQVEENQEYVGEPVYQSDNFATSSSASASGRSYGPVKRHETLWSIAFSQRNDPSISMDQMQLAIYQANPDAFDGNINQMRTGSILNIPPANEIQAIDPAYAKREVAQQRARNRTAAAPRPAAPKPRSLPPIVQVPTEVEAVDPEPEPEPAPEPEPVVEPEAPAAPQQKEMASSPEGEQIGTVLPSSQEVLAEDAEGTVTEEGGEEPIPAQAASSATADGDALTQDELIAEGDQADSDSGEIEMPSVWVDEEAGEGEVQPEAVQEDTEAEPVVDEAPPETGSGLGEVLSPVTLGLALILLIALLVTYWWYRKRKVTNVGNQFAYASEDDAESEKPKDAEATDNAEGADAPATGNVWNDTGEVPDSIDEYTASTPGADELDLDSPASSDYSQPVVDTAIELDAEEPSPIREMTGEEIDYLGEADVHLAYGLYDEAASVLQRGINENPNRSDLRLKLLDVYHSGSMRDEFVQAAVAWQSAGVSNEADWEKAVKMGQEIAPDAELFASDSVESPEPVQTASAEIEAEPAEIEADIGADLSSSFSAPEVEPEAAAEETKAEEKADDSALEFDLSGFDISSPADVSEDSADEVQDTGAEENIDLPDFGALDDIESGSAVDAVSDDDLDAELSTLDSPSESDLQDSDPLDIDLSGMSLDDSTDDAEVGTQLDDPAFDAEPLAEDSVDAINPADSMDKELEIEEPTRVEPTDSDGADDLNLSVDPAFDGGDEVSISDDPDQDASDGSAEGDEEEVSVKLDLARAYLDMGEPEMARTLLDEVVEMGSEQQRQEAKDLISRSA